MAVLSPRGAAAAAGHRSRHRRDGRRTLRGVGRGRLRRAPDPGPSVQPNRGGRLRHRSGRRGHRLALTAGTPDEPTRASASAASSPGTTMTASRRDRTAIAGCGGGGRRAGSNRSRATTTGTDEADADPSVTVANADIDRRTALMVPRPASATSTTASGRQRRTRSMASPSAAWGERTPPAGSTTPRLTGGRGQSSSATRSADGEGGKAEGLGRHRGSHGQRERPVMTRHTAVGSSPEAAARTTASVSVRVACRRRRTGPACGPPPTVPVAGIHRSTAAATQVLPTSVPVPHTTHHPLRARPGSRPVDPSVPQLSHAEESCRRCPPPTQPTGP